MKETSGFSHLKQCLVHSQTLLLLPYVGGLLCCVPFLFCFLATQDERHSLFQFTSLFLKIHPACKL